MVHSDHCALSFSLSNDQLRKPPIDKCRPKKDKTNLVMYKWDPTLIAVYREQLNSTSCMNLYERLLCKIADCDYEQKTAIDIFNDYISTAIGQHFKKRKALHTSNFPCNKWFDDECKEAKRILHDKGKTIITIAERQAYNALMKKYKALIQRKKRKFQQNIAAEVKHINESDPQEYWRFWKRHKPPPQICDLLDPDQFTAYYKRMETRPVGDCFDNQLMENIEEFISRYADETPLNVIDIVDDILNAPIDTNEIMASLKRVKANKAAGADGISAEFYKCAGDILALPLTALFNHVMLTGLYPNTWCAGLINPLHKKDSPFLPDNYRKITITPAIGKIFDGILNNRLQFAKECLGTGDPFQNGFKPNASAIDNIFILNGIIDKCKAIGRPLYACFVDFKSAFDLINRSALLYKLMNQGCNGKFLAVIKSMFRNATSRVKWGGHLGEIFENIYGVLQGGVLSPNLFKLYLEDLPDYLNAEKGIYIGGIKIPYLLFADDLVLMSESPTGLQNLIHGLEMFCSQWHMVVNLTKTKVVVFNSKLANDALPFVFNDNDVPISKQYNYLGVIFSDGKDRFGENYAQKYGKVLRAIYASRNLVRDVIGPDIAATVLFKVFDTQIQPIIDYGSEVCYNGKPNSRLESLHLSYLKRALGVKSQTSNLAVFGETGRCPIMVRQEKLVIGYWLKLMNICPNNPLKLVYNELHQLSTEGYTTWCTHVGSLLKSVGMENIWDEQKLLVSVDNFKQLKAGFKNELENCYAQKWIKEINDIDRHPILRTYIGFKNKFCQEKYIERLNIRKYQRAISRFRVSSHRLGIETGRHQKPSLPPDKRLCKYCKSGKVDDELHFLVHCDFHSKTRKLFFSQLCEIITDFHRLNDVDKFREILMSTNEDVIVSLGKFIYDGFKSRDQICISTSWNVCILIACFIPIL